MKQIIGFLVLVVLFAPVGCGGAGGIGTSANASPSNLLLAGVGKTIQVYYGAYGTLSPMVRSRSLTPMYSVKFPYKGK